MIFFNQSLDPRIQYAQPTRQPLEFHQRLATYASTPLHVVDSFARQLGVDRVYIKNESQRLGLPAFKILGASWATYKALSELYPNVMADWLTTEEVAARLREHHPPTLLSATDGNHGRAVARSARLFGLRSRVFVPSGTAAVRISAIEGECAEVVIVDGTYDDAIAQAANEAKATGGLLIQDSSWQGYETIARCVVEGYSTMFWEIDDALATMGEGDPTHVIVQIGNGSLAEAVIRHYRSKNQQAIIIGVEPDSAACASESVRAGKIVRLAGPFDSIMVGMNCDSPSLISFPVMQKGIDAFVALSDAKAIEAMKLYARERITSGETGAAGLGALCELRSTANSDSVARLQFDRQSRILVVVTEGATDPVFYDRIVRS